MRAGFAAMRPAARHLAAWAVVLAALAAVFTAYLNPQLAFDLATRVWACF
jgi:hypothetical protein